MYRRLIDLVGTVGRDPILAAGESGLASIGVTRQKAGYLVSLAEAVLGGAPRHRRARQTWQRSEAHTRLVSMKGIGQWTADAYLLSALRLPDIFPVGDRALQVGVAEALGLGEIPSPDALYVLSAPVAPGSGRGSPADLASLSRASRPLRTGAPGHMSPGTA